MFSFHNFPSLNAFQMFTFVLMNFKYFLFQSLCLPGTSYKFAVSFLFQNLKNITEKLKERDVERKIEMFE